MRTGHIDRCFFFLLGFTLFLCPVGLLGAQDAAAPGSEIVSLSSAVTYYYSTSPDAEELQAIQNNIKEKLLFQWAVLKTREDVDSEQLRVLLEIAECYAHVCSWDTLDSIPLLADIRDSALEYLKKNDTDTMLQLALVSLVSTQFRYSVPPFYQNTRIIKDLASRIHLKEHDAKSAMILGKVYLSSVTAKGHSMTYTQWKADKYLKRSIELDNKQSYITYLGYIFLANLYFKLGRMKMAHTYISHARAYYTHGTLANAVEESLEEGIALF